MRSIALPLSLLLAGLLTACAHPMVISPDLSKMRVVPVNQPISKNVGYYVGDAKRQLKVVSAGGGGDGVSYKPYADTETAIYGVLNNVFGTVVVLKAADDSETIHKHQLSYVIQPELKTRSSSSNPLLWAPTDFEVEILCTITDAQGAPVASPRVVGRGQGNVSEIRADPSISGKRASADAMRQLQDALENTPELR